MARAARNGEATERFTGFPAEAFEFFGDLAVHNDRDWFQAHKDVYERACRAPLLALVAELEPELGKAWVSRINRDLRFARDRSPYKTHIAAAMGGRYVALSAEGVWAGAGLYRPEPPVLKKLRDAIDDDTKGGRLQQIVTGLRRKGYEVGSHETLASAPRGYDADHPRIDLLRLKDLYAGKDFPPAGWLSTRAALVRIRKVVDDTGPLVEWLRANVRRGPRQPRKR